MLAATAAAEARAFGTTPDAVSGMDRWLERTGKRWSIDERMAFRARVCISELAANVLEHGHIAAGVGRIRIELRHKPPILEIEMSDPGEPFDPTMAPPDADRDRIGGRGLRLVHSYAHKLSYRRARDRNIVTLEFTLPSP